MDTAIERDVVIMIPARLHSTRLPEKMIQPITPNGKTMPRLVYEQAVSLGLRTYLVYDHGIIRSRAYTSPECAIQIDQDCICGSDRIAEATKILRQKEDFEFVVNWQADELVDPRPIMNFIERCYRAKYMVANVLRTLYTKEIRDTNQVKAQLSKMHPWGDGQVEYYSRNPDCIDGAQIGIYWFHKVTLMNYYGVPRLKSLAEKLSGVELNHLIEKGALVEGLLYPSSIKRLKLDTEEDLRTLREVTARCPRFPEQHLPG